LKRIKCRGGDGDISSSAYEGIWESVVSSPNDVCGGATAEIRYGAFLTAKSGCW